MLELKTYNPEQKKLSNNHASKVIMPEIVRKDKKVSKPENDYYNAKLNNKELYNFTRQLANLLKAGMEIPVALEILASQTNKRHIKGIIELFLKEVNAGKSLADAMSLCPAAFSEMFVSVVYSAQTGGDLDKSLEYLADMLEKKNKISTQVNRALAYPALMLSVSITVIIFLMTTVIPNISNLFLETGRDLPFITKSLIFVSNAMQVSAPYLAGLLAIIFFAGKYYIRKSEVRAKLDKKLLDLPYIGNYLLEIETVRLCRSLCAMLKGGLTIVDSMELAKGAVSNRSIKESIVNIANGLTKGQSIEESFRKYGIFQPMVHHSIAIGESTGELEKQLASVSDMLDEEIDNKTSFLTTMMEPIIMLIMGLLTGYIVAAMLLPIFEINTTF